MKTNFGHTSPPRRTIPHWQTKKRNNHQTRQLPSEMAATIADFLTKLKPWLILVATLIMLATLFPFVTTGQKMIRDGHVLGWLILIAPLLFGISGMIVVNRRLTQVVAHLRRARMEDRPQARTSITVHEPSPYPSNQTIRPGREGNGWIRGVLFVLIVSIVIWQPWQQENLSEPMKYALQRLKRLLNSTLSPDTQTPLSYSASGSSRLERFELLARQIGDSPSPCPELLAMEASLAHSNDRVTLERRLKEALLCKIQRPEYQLARAERLLDLGPPFPEEAFIRTLRNRLAQMRPPPANTEIYKVPLVSTRPTVDGILQANEWSDALTLEPPGTRTRVLLIADRHRLYVAADVGDQTTPHPWNSLRLILHDQLSPWMDEEYVFVYGRGSVNSGCRISGVKWPDPPPGGFSDQDRWKRYRLNECGLYHQARGNSTLQGHRMYEVSLDLEEAGIPHDHPFPLRLEIEDTPLESIDPATGRRRFQHRRYIGTLSPNGDRWLIWLMLD